MSSGTEDPRFPPVEKEELDTLVYSVDVLGAPEPVSSPGELDVKKYGVIVTKGRKRGTPAAGFGRGWTLWRSRSPSPGERRESGKRTR